MRVLILSAAILACVSAAPSGSVVLPVVKAVPIIPAAVPTIDPGDIEAAAINAKVIAEDKAQEQVDQARDLAELAVETTNDKVIENTDLVKEKVEEDFWSVEDKKWQAVDAVKTAEAQIDGAVANNAQAIARSAVGGVVIPTFLAPIPARFAPLPAPIAPPAPILQFPSPLVYTAPGFINFEPPKYIEEKKEEVAVKATEEKKEEKNKIESTEKVKSAEPEKVGEANNLALGSVFVAPTIKLTQPFLTAPVTYQYIPQYTVPQIQTPFLAPTVIKTQW